MKIQNLIKRLQEIQEKHGDLECVVETENFYGDKIFSTVEDLRLKNFQDKPAIFLDWRC